MVTEVGSERGTLDRAPERPSAGRRPAAPQRGRALRTAPVGAPRGPRPPSRPRDGSERVVGLDALRALAVVLVVAYHVFPAALPGGFLGVDVFFVVSGFIITTLLLRELTGTRRIRLREFWRRRARRLLPALGVVVVVCVVAARIVAPDLLVGIGRQVLGAATFSTNWIEVAAGQSYFDETQPVLFQTFWSLAVEEQFYLLWPVVLVVLIVLTPTVRSRVRVVTLAALASAVAMAVLSTPGGDPTRVYYGTDTHAFGLLLGAAVALRRATGARLLSDRATRWAVPAGVVGLGVLVLTLSAGSAWTYRGGILAASLLALLLVARCADATTDTAVTGRRAAGVRVVEMRPVVWVGARSYGLYLWHWPVILLVDAVVQAQPGTLPWWRGTAVAVVITVLAAAASYRWIETPVRRDGFRGTAARVRAATASSAPRAVTTRAVAGLAAAAVLVAVVAVVTAPTTSQAQRAVEQGQAAIAARSTGPVAEQGAGPGTEQDAVAEGSRDGDAGTRKADGAPKADGAQKADGDGAAGTRPQKITGKQISAFGDSVLSGAAPALLDRFPGIAVDGKPIRKWVDAPAVVRKAERRGELRDVVVLQFGTNGGFAWEGAEAAFEEVLDLVGPDRDVVVFSVVGVSDWVPSTNETLERIAAERDNVHVAPWADAVRDRPGLLYDDRTHPDLEGIAVYAKVLRQTLAEIR
jgi:peptidoglycan/LPS O-acetylase OafA/YrhL